MNIEKRTDRMIEEATTIQENLADLYQTNGLQLMAVRQKKEVLNDLAERMKEE